MTIRGTWDDWAPWLKERGGEVRTSVAFLTRLPLPRVSPAGLDVAPATLASASWAFPLAGLATGVIGAVIYGLADRLAIPAWPAAALAVAATLAVSGCLHEDGLADTADGFGGGKSAEGKLAIMRDSRIGTYGACALMLSILLRTGALAGMADTGLVVAALIAAHAGARSALPAVMFFVPPARRDGLSFAAGRPPAAGAAVGAALGFVILAVCIGPWPAIEAAIVLAIVVALLARLSISQIGGQTGDVLGAIEQVAEIVILLVALR